MKKLLLPFLVLFASTQLPAQTYYKFLNNSSWYESSNPGFGLPITYFYYNQSTDTVISSLTYSKVLITGGGSTFFVREDTLAHKVYIRTINDTAEVILYDFSLNVGDTFYAKHGWSAGTTMTVTSITTVNTLQGTRRVFSLSDSSGNFGFSTIESIGCTIDPFLNDYPGGDPQSLLVCSYQNHVQQYDCNCAILNNFQCFAYPENICFDTAQSLVRDPYNVNVLASADFNMDGNADLATNHWNSNNNIAISLSDGAGGFLAPTDFPAMYPYALICADLNNDGMVDIATTSYANGSVLLGDGAGGFTSTPYSSGYGNSLISADLNSDGNLDLAVTSNNGLSVYLGNGTGTFTSTVNSLSGAYLKALASADFNNDGKADIAVTGTGLSVLLGNGSGGFPSQVNLPYAPNAVITADFNIDGMADLAITNSGTVSVLLGDNTGQFPNVINIPVKSDLNAITSSDFDGDGKLDLAVGSGTIYTGANTPGCVTILVGNNTGNFMIADSLAVYGGPYNMVTSDFNNDGHVDLATTTFTASTVVSVLIGCSTGNDTLDTTSIQQQKTYVQAELYPNPCSTILNIEWPERNEITEVMVLDLLGKEMKHEFVNRKSRRVVLDVSNVPAGIYFVSARTKTETFTRKVIVQH